MGLTRPDSRVTVADGTVIDSHLFTKSEIIHTTTNVTHIC